MNTHHGIVNRRSRQSGFSLLEVLIAIVITSIGLLGLAAMQATALRNNHSSYHRSQATVLAYDIADRMRSNASSMASYVTPEEVDTSGDDTSSVSSAKATTSSGTQSSSGGVALDIVQVVGDGTGDQDDVDPLAGCRTTGGCTAAQLAQNDIAEWNADMAAALPGGTGSIVLAGGIYTINVNWDDNRDGSVDANDPGLQVSFQP